MTRIVALLTACLLICFSVMAQVHEKPDHDTAYYRSFKGTIIAKTYLSRTYVHFNMDPPGNLSKMSYRANTTLNLGVGISYRSLSFSYSKGLYFLHSNRTKGPTHSTDLQLHLYKRKWTIDALASFYRGYYLNPHGLGSPDGRTYYTRPDINTKLFGVSVYRILNDQRFSYGAGLSQNAWQQRSAGSFLIGAEAFYITSHADSAFAPRKVDPAYNGENIHKLHLLEIGPGIGYTYTLVVKKHFFLLGSFNANINFRWSHETGNGIGADKFGFSPNYLLRLGTGYTSSRWSLNFQWLTTGVNTEGKASGYQYSLSTGNYRLIYARRIAINHKMKEILRDDSY